MADQRSELKEKFPFDQYFGECFPENVRSNNMALCPWHEDTDPSLELKKRHGLCYGACKNGSKVKSYDIFDLHRKRFDTDFPTAKKELAKRAGIALQSKGKGSKGRLEAEHLYPDTNGEPYQMVRRFRKDNGEKDFKMFLWDGAKREYVPGLRGTQRIIYNSAQVTKAQQVFIAEGEKCCDSLSSLNLAATTNPGGATNWHVVCVNGQPPEALRDKDVVILPDDDDKGRRHAEMVARSLRDTSRSLKIVELPGLPEKGDFVDFKAQHGPEEAKRLLLDLVEKAPEYVPPPEIAIAKNWAAPKIVSCYDLMNTEIAAPKWAAEDLLPEGLTILSAKPKSGKSFLAQNISLAVAMGTRALGHFGTVQATTLNLCLEDNDRRMKGRFALMVDGHEPPKNHLLVTSWPPMKKGGLDLLDKTLEENRDIKLVVIDTWARFKAKSAGRNDDAYSTDYADLHELHGLAARYELAILLVHHSRKEKSEDVFDSILGSTAIAGAADSLMILNRKSRTDPTATLFVTGRDIEDAELALSFEAGAWKYEGNPADLRLTTDRREIRQVLLDAAKPLGITEISGKTGKNYRAIQKLVYRMVEKGDLAKAVGSAAKYVLPPEDSLYGGPWAGPSQNEIQMDHI